MRVAREQGTDSPILREHLILVLAPRTMGTCRVLRNRKQKLHHKKVQSGRIKYWSFILQEQLHVAIEMSATFPTLNHL